MKDIEQVKSMFNLENVFVTEGKPEYTFVQPPNYQDILLDIRTPGKPVVIEGQSGSGKTTTVKQVINEIYKDQQYEYFSARRPTDVSKIKHLFTNNKPSGIYIIDDFHKLEEEFQSIIIELAKVETEEEIQARTTKIIIIGINKLGSSLIQVTHDIGKRLGIHKIAPADEKAILDLIQKGSNLLNISIETPKLIYEESKGDYWLTQTLCQNLCKINNVNQTQQNTRSIDIDIDQLRDRVIKMLSQIYFHTVETFCKGVKFRKSNDPYFKVLNAISKSDHSVVDLNSIRKFDENVQGSVNNIKEGRLSTLIAQKELDQWFYYDKNTKLFSIEDPALFYYIKHLNWESMRESCGFESGIKNYSFDFSISYASENLALASAIEERLSSLDLTVFLDRLYESNFLGLSLQDYLTSVFRDNTRFILVILDNLHKTKLWTTFERTVFRHRVGDGSIIPIFLDDTVFLEISEDIYGFKSNVDPDHIVFTLIDKLDS